MENPYQAQLRSLCPFFSARVTVLTLSLELKLESPSTYTERSGSYVPVDKRDERVGPDSLRAPRTRDRQIDGDSPNTRLKLVHPP
jgi:hypothetical protein